MKDQDFIDQIIAELINAFGSALGLVTGAIARNGDAEQLHANLSAQIKAAQTTKLAPELAIHLATQALAAVHAEVEHRKLERAQAKH